MHDAERRAVDDRHRAARGVGNDREPAADGLDAPRAGLGAEAAQEYLAELSSGGLDTLILGCTHYPLIAPLIAELMGPEVRLIDSGAEAARAIAALLRDRGQLSGRDPEHRFYLTDEPRNFARVARAFLGRELPPTTIVDQTDQPWFERLPAR